MGHVIEFGHSVVLERLRLVLYSWWCRVDGGTCRGLRSVEVYEPYKVAVEGQTEGSWTLELYRRQDNVAKDGTGEEKMRLIDLNRSY